MGRSDRLALLLILAPDGKFAAKDIGSILHRQKGVGYDLYVVSCRGAQKIPESLKKTAKKIYLTDSPSVGREVNRIVSEGHYGAVAFLTDRVIPTHDHWLKRICAPIMDSGADAAFGREIPSQSGNYFHLKDINDSFPLKSDVDQSLFTMDNCAIAAELLTQTGFATNGTYDPAASWVQKKKVTASYEPDAIVMRQGEATLKEVFERYRQKGADSYSPGKKVTLFKAITGAAAAIARDLRYCLSLKKPQHAWYPFLYRSAIHFGQYAGRKKGVTHDEKS